MEISELKKGQRFYDVLYYRVVWYTYLEVHPHSDNYHILLDMNEDPMRMHYSKLEVILDKGLDTYEKAELHLADLLERKVKSLREPKHSR